MGLVEFSVLFSSAIKILEFASQRCGEGGMGAYVEDQCIYINQDSLTCSFIGVVTTSFPRIVEVGSSN
jgi:hypothetical protein